MHLAAREAWTYLQHRYLSAEHLLVCCGKGNNGGDGLVIARLAHANGWRVQVVLADGVPQTPAAARAMTNCQSVGIQFLTLDEVDFSSVDVIVDALLGTGVSGELRPAYALSLIHI